MWLVCTVAAVAAASAGATIYYEEQFEGSFPPAGWAYSGSGVGSATWSRQAGPWDYYLSAGIAIAGGQNYTVYITGPYAAVPASTTLYIRFDYMVSNSGAYGTASAQVERPPGITLANFALTDPTGWKALSEPFDTSTYTSVRVAYHLNGHANVWPTGYSGMGLDRIYISDSPAMAVAPVSLGRVRALFK